MAVTKTYKKSRLHVCLVTPAYPPTIDGFSTYIRDLAVSLVKLGQKVTVICADSTHGPLLSDQEIIDSGIRVIWLCQQFNIFHKALRFATGLSQSAWSLRIYNALVKYHYQIPFDLIEFTNWGAQGLIHSLHKIVPQVVRVTTGIKQVLSFGYTDSIGPRNILSKTLEGLVVRRLHFLEKLSVRRSDFLILPSKGHWNAIENIYGLTSVDKAKATIIPFGTNTYKVKTSSKKLDDWPCQILFVGRLSYRKGFDVFMKSLPMVFAAAKGKVKVTILGQDTLYDPNGTSFWDKFSSELNNELRSNIEYRGPVNDDVRDEAYSQCAIFVAPSRYESFGLMYIEAMCYGVPVIGCNNGGAPEVIKNNVTGVIVEPGNMIALAEALLILINNPPLRHRMGQAGRKSAINFFSRERMAEKTLELYHDITSRT